MPNLESYPASLFPLRGDVSAEAGNTTVRVQGIQTIPFTNTPPVNGQVPTFVAANSDIEWGQGKSAVFINGIGVSEDYLILINTAFTINYSTDKFLGVRINGV